MRTVICYFTIFIALTCSTRSAGQSHPFSVYDMHAAERISEPSVSPDGKRIVFTLGQTDFLANTGRTDIWLINADGTQLQQLTTHPYADYNPCWSPDGKSIWFLSTRTSSSQVWKIDIESGQIHQITNEPLDIGNLILSPDGKHIAFTMEVFPDANSPEQTKQKLNQIQQKLSTGLVFENIFVRLGWLRGVYRGIVKVKIG
ncbi:TolB family protein [Planctomycetota bacterium]